MARHNSFKRSKQKQSIKPNELVDSLTSVATSLGEKTRSVNYLYSRNRLQDAELTRMFRNSWITSRYLLKTADDMLKIEREFTGEYSSEALNIVKNTELKLNIKDVLRKAIIWSKLYGDALIVAITDSDVKELPNELMPDEKIIKFIVLAKTEYTISKDVSDDITSRNFGCPISYQIKTGNLTVHHSRCQRIINGVSLLTSNDKYGIPDIQQAYESIKAFELAMLCISDLLQESNVDVITVSGLSDRISSGQEDQIVKYGQLMKAMKSHSGLMLVDAGTVDRPSNYDQKSVNFSGLSEAVSKLAIALSGALNRPLTILFGESASGFSSGEEDNASYYETIKGLQEIILRPAYDFIDSFILDKFMTSDNIFYDFPSIDSPNQTEEATTFNTYSTGISALVTAQVLSPKQAARELKNKGIVQTLTDDDINELGDSNLGFDYGAG